MRVHVVVVFLCLFFVLARLDVAWFTEARNLYRAVKKTHVRAVQPVV